MPDMSHWPVPVHALLLSMLALQDGPPLQLIELDG
jgi:hypothetical protein